MDSSLVSTAAVEVPVPSLSTGVTACVVGSVLGTLSLSDVGGGVAATVSVVVNAFGVAILAVVVWVIQLPMRIKTDPENQCRFLIGGLFDGVRMRLSDLGLEEMDFTCVFNR